MNIEKFDFKNYPLPLSDKVVVYICPKCKHKFEAPLEAVLEFEEEDELIIFLSLLFVLSVVINYVFQWIINLKKVITISTKKIN